MCDFNTLSDEEKQPHHTKLLEYGKNFDGNNFDGNNFGRKNFFPHLLEAIHATKSHPVTAGNMSFDIEPGSIPWNKVIFNDKLQLLLFFCSVDTVKKVLNYTPKV